MSHLIGCNKQFIIYSLLWSPCSLDKKRFIRIIRSDEKRLKLVEKRLKLDEIKITNRISSYDPSTSWKKNLYTIFISCYIPPNVLICMNITSVLGMMRCKVMMHAMINNYSSLSLQLYVFPFRGPATGNIILTLVFFKF